MNDTTPSVETTPWWIRGAMVVLILGLVFGASVGLYMGWHHDVAVYGGPDVQFELVGCAESEGVSCDVVNTSAWSEVLGVPTFTWAVPTYLMMILASVQLFLGRRGYAWPLVASAVAASAFSGFLWYISVSELQHVCLWCMRLYAVNFGALLLAIVAALPVGGRGWPPLPGVQDLLVLGGAFAVVAGVTVGVEQSMRASLLGDAPEALAHTAVEVPEDPADHVDPEGDLEPRELQIVTEKGETRTLSLKATDAWKGNPDARVVLVEFADLECGFCRRTSSELASLYRAYGDQVLFVFRHYPLNNECNPGASSRKHRDACNAALGAICAQEQGRFWAFHDLAFKNQHELDTRALSLYAESLDLDMDAWRRCVVAPETRERLAADGAVGKDLQIGGTPRIWIDGKLYRAGTSARQMAKALESALGVRGTEAASRMAAVSGGDATPIQPIPADVPEMQTLTHGDQTFRIDTFESALTDEGRATSGVHAIPATRMSWFAARDACESAGKRMCTEQEWITACQGAAAVDDDGDGQFADDMIEGRVYPYGDLHERPRCWSARDSQKERPVYTGEMPGCVGPDGVYDLVGNVEEWVGSSPETAVLLGGSWDTRDDKARCYRRNDTYGAGFANRRTGFRCCADPEDAAPADVSTDEPDGT